MMKLFQFNSIFAFKKHFDFLLKGKMNDVNWFSVWICCSASVIGQLIIIAGWKRAIALCREHLKEIQKNFRWFRMRK